MGRFSSVLADIDGQARRIASDYGRLLAHRGGSLPAPNVTVASVTTRDARVQVQPLVGPHPRPHQQGPSAGPQPTHAGNETLHASPEGQGDIRMVVVRLIRPIIRLVLRRR